MEEMSRSSVTLCPSLPKCKNGYLAIGCDGNCRVIDLKTTAMAVCQVYAP